MSRGTLLCTALLCSALFTGLTSAQPRLVATPVAGKLGYQPGTYFCEAIVVPAQSTAYLSGQTGGNSTDFPTQVRKALTGLNTTLTGLGSRMDAVVKTTVYMTDISLFSEMNAVYTTYFTPNTLPARSTVEVASLVGTTAIEIDFVAVDPVFATMSASS